jgi:tripartite-type tricarboxylate transporter receptor subunit TctC
MRHLSRPALLLAALLCATSARAAFPDRPIHLIVPFLPGASTDIVARLVGAKVGQMLGQAVIVENRAGAGASIGSDYVAKSAPDGYTLLMATSSHTANPYIYKKLPYDTVKSFESISEVADMPGVLVSYPGFPPKTFKEFVEYAKTHKVTFGSAGSGTFPHLSMELLRSRMGVEMTHVPYRGASAALTDLVGGVYDVKMDAYISAAGFIHSGKLRALAVASLQRMPQLPDVPTIAESGYPGFESTYWLAIVAPAGTPPQVRATLEKAFIDAVHDPEVSAKLNETGTRPIGGTAQQLDALIQKELKQWPSVIKDANITAQ